MTSRADATRRAALDAVRSASTAWASVFAKDQVVRRGEVPLGFELADWTDADYDAVADYMAPLEAEASEAPMTPSGLRWCHHGESVLFEMARTLKAPYDDLVARVDIASAIRRMNDYIGGHSEVVTRDGRSRVTRQAERNIYLPQPNWIALSGGDVIDVCKLEVVHYEDDRQKIAWRTIASPNGSAVHDDGTVTYERLDGDRTRVTVRGLQEFTLPPFWAALDPWMAPAVKDALIEDSYRRFFTATLDNVEAEYEGRDYRIGRDHDPADDEPLDERLRQTWTVLRGMLPERPLEALARQVQSRTAPEADEVDDDGFRHFSGANTNGAQPAEPPAWATAGQRWLAEWSEVVAEDASRRSANGG